MTSVDEEASGGGNIRQVVPLKRRPWTKAEDEILMDYIAKHRKGNWNSIHKVTGLARCGKSCRLRWSNHLRPGLKKGPFSPEEESYVVELHAKIGNKWSQIAAELPGRSDNDIKNFWNTRRKKLWRAGLLMDPPNVCSQAFSEEKQNKETGAALSANSQSDLLASYTFEIPAAEFKNFEPSFPDIPGMSLLDGSLFSRSLGSSSWYPSFSGEIHQPSSDPKKQDLPSIQTPMASWGSHSSIEHTDPGSLTLSPGNSGLLDAILYGSQTSKTSWNNSQQEQTSGVATDSKSTYGVE